MSTPNNPATTPAQAPAAPPPVDPREVQRLVETQDWKVVRTKLVNCALAFGCTRDDAEDLAQEAIAREWDPETRTWNPAK